MTCVLVKALNSTIDESAISPSTTKFSYDYGDIGKIYNYYFDGLELLHCIYDSKRVESVSFMAWLVPFKATAWITLLALLLLLGVVTLVQLKCKSGIQSDPFGLLGILLNFSGLLFHQALTNKSIAKMSKLIITAFLLASIVITWSYEFYLIPHLITPPPSNAYSSLKDLMAAKYQVWLSDAAFLDPLKEEFTLERYPSMQTRPSICTKKRLTKD
ncbi:hypothetical protein Fcan01_25775 [Folsomia candida]|uniref:Uncharacterized protein n=1 Tax=Folsomia candida TaxID=158441 RepID=A0A226D1T1_FOLCA|nr:hypothetical protein Fcan01_25775 [Folsomia candida]